jgi:hypothetical protein
MLYLTPIYVPCVRASSFTSYDDAAPVTDARINHQF